MPATWRRRPGTTYFTTVPAATTSRRPRTPSRRWPRRSAHRPDQDAADHEHRARAGSGTRMPTRPTATSTAAIEGQVALTGSNPCHRGERPRADARSPGHRSGASVEVRSEAQCFVVRASWRRRGGELVGLVDHVGGDLLELVAVLAGVVGAEQELAAGLELHAQVGLGAATVATVRGAQRAVLGATAVVTSASFL